MRFSTGQASWLILAVALAFLAGGVWDITNREWMEAAAALGIGSFMLGLFLHRRRERRVELELRAWLAANAAAIIGGGGASYHGHWITAGTRTRQLTLCVSVLIAAFRLPSRPLVEGLDAIGVRTAVYSLGTLLLGWWSIHGLFWTPAALFNNVRGGQEATIEQHLAAMGIRSVPARANVG